MIVAEARQRPPGLGHETAAANHFQDPSALLQSPTASRVRLSARGLMPSPMGASYFDCTLKPGMGLLSARATQTVFHPSRHPIRQPASRTGVAKVSLQQGLLHTTTQQEQDTLPQASRSDQCSTNGVFEGEELSGIAVGE